MVVSCNGGIGVWEKKISQILYVLPIEKKRGSGRDREKKRERGKDWRKLQGGKKKHGVGKIGKRCGKWERTKILAIATETFDVIQKIFYCNKEL